MNVSADLGQAMELFKKHNGLSEHEKMTFELFESDYYYSAAFFAKRHLIQAKSITPAFEQVMERLVQRTGSDTFSDLPTDVLSKHAQQAPTLAFTLGQRYFKERNFEKAIQLLSSIPDDHRFYVESQLSISGLHTLKGQVDKAKEHYTICMKHGAKMATSSGQDKLRRYYVVIAEQCRVNLARLDYADKKFPEGLETYEKIDKRSFLWPSLLLEKAWASYMLQDYNRSLGLLVTYKSPLMEQYFFPESEVLAALSYYRLCLWDDSLTVVEHFYNHYAPKSEELKKVINAHRESHDWFYELSLLERSKQMEIAPYVPQMMTQIKKSVKFSLDLIGIRKAEQELKDLQALPQGLFKTLLISEVSDSRDFHRRQLNHFIKEQFFSLVNKINSLSYEMFNIKLEIMSKKRDLIYKNQKLVAERGRGDSSNVKRNSKQYFWDFKGEFWADELGEYSFGLKSNCEIVDQKTASL
jgi:hypothetical protein